MTSASTGDENVVRMASRGEQAVGSASPADRRAPAPGRRTALRAAASSAAIRPEPGSTVWTRHVPAGVHAGLQPQAPVLFHLRARRRERARHAIDEAFRRPRRQHHERRRLVVRPMAQIAVDVLAGVAVRGIGQDAAAAERPRPEVHRSLEPRDQLPARQHPRDARLDPRPVRLVDVVETAAVEHFLDVRLRERRADREPAGRLVSTWPEPKSAAPSARPNGPGTGATRNAPTRACTAPTTATDSNRLPLAITPSPFPAWATTSPAISARRATRLAASPLRTSRTLTCIGAGSVSGPGASAPARPTVSARRDADTSIVPSR